MFERIVFAADVHLQPGPHEKTDRFLAFLQTAAKDNEAIFLLGDLFEFWIGPKHAKRDDYQTVLQAFQAVADADCKLFFLGGNRDFHFHGPTGKAFGIEVCSDPRIVQLGERRIYLTHGDGLCWSDVTYLRMKRILQNPVVKFVSRHLPLALSMRIANRLRTKSKAEISTKEAYKMDLTPAAVRQVFEQGNDVLICGHVHKPRHEQVPIQGRACELLVVGDWDGPAQYVQYADKQFLIQEWS